jgi:hypothetical protein
LVTALDEALSMDPQTRLVLGYRARSAVLNGYSLQSMREATLEVYEEVLNGKVALAA